MISIAALLNAVILILVLGLVFGLLHWLIGHVGARFPNMVPFAEVARIVLVVGAVLVLIGILLSLAGYPVVRWGP